MRHICKWRVILMGLFLLGGCSCFALQRQLSFTHLDIGDGLIHNQVNCIMKDAKGFVWLGTPSGLSRYDGRHFINFRHNSNDSTSLTDNYIESIYNLPGGYLWIKSRSSSDIFDPRKMRFSHDKNAFLKALGLPAGEVQQIRRISTDKYLFIYKDKGVVLYESPNYLQVLPKITFFPASPVFITADATVDRSGKIWVISQTGILISFEPSLGKWQVAAKLAKAPQGDKTKLSQPTQSYRVFADSKGAVWIYNSGRPGALFTLQRGESNFKVYQENKLSSGNAPGLNNNIINALTEDDQGNIWVGTDHGGINIINPHNGSVRYLMNNPENQKSLAQNCIYDLYKDDNGLIWVGTYKKGVCYYNERMDRFPLYSHDPNQTGPRRTLPFEDVNRFVEDESGNLWIGTNGGGLIYYNQQDSTFKRFTHKAGDPSSLCADVIVGLCYDSQHRLWIGTYYGGLDCYQNGRFTHYRHHEDNPQSLSDDRVWDIIEDKNKAIWIATLGGGLQKMDPATGIFTTYPPSHPNLDGSAYVVTLDQLSNGDLWAGTAAGIDIYPKSGGQPRHLGNIAGNQQSLSNDNINTIYEDQKGDVWVGTREGLNCIDPKTGFIRRFTTQDGLPDNTILTILEDQQHYLWMSTPNGLIRFRPPATMTDSIKASAFRKFDESDGLQGREFNEKSAFKTKAGLLIFGGAGGFNMFNPGDIHIDYHTPPIVFTELQIGGKTTAIDKKYSGRTILKNAPSWTSHLTLPYGASDFSLSFMALGYGHSSRIKYAYRLKGFNEDWILIENNADNRATYTNLNPGDYTLEVKSCNQDGIWNNRPTTMQLSILPPFWKTSWAYLIYLLLLAGVLYMARSILLYRARMRFELDRQRQQASHTHDMDMLKIRFLTNISHEFRTPLSLILAPLEKLMKEVQEPALKTQLDMVRRNAKRLLHLVSQLLDLRKMEVQEIALHPTRADIVSFVKDTAISFTDIAEKKNINFTIISLPTGLQANFDPDKLERILFNLLSNAFKFTPEGGTITLTMAQETTPNEVQMADTEGQVNNKDLASEKLSEKVNEKNWISIAIQDNGIGIPDDKLHQIFERFFQHALPYQMVNAGSGIGLSITQEFVRLHGGRIEVSSLEGKGSCFTVYLPLMSYAGTDLVAEKELTTATSYTAGIAIENALQQRSLTPVDNDAEREVVENDEQKAGQATEGGAHGVKMHIELLHADQHSEATNDGKSGKNKLDGRKKTILLVEDHEDFRFYLKDNLGVQFNILQAADGQKGWDLCLSARPDLVVSDIMMEGMDGLQLCRKIKKDPRTSSIPVILLSAKAAASQQVEGLKHGANDYMTKPFNFEVLQARIMNLLSQVKQSKKDTPAKIEIQPKNTPIDSQQEQFLQAAKQAVEAAMDDSDFSVEQLSQALYVSRVTLYKKLVAITGKTPIEFIRTLKVKKAAIYLQKGMNVAQAAYEVGYNNPKNFTKHFKQVFGMLPSEYSQQMKEQKMDDFAKPDPDPDPDPNKS
ncbi:hybrid sensor histidine kinase/response regulator transcription factor [Arachidicoccus ginsenosidivorans]